MTVLDPLAAAAAAESGAAQYMLAPATRLLWRSPTAVHLELGSRAVLVEGLPVPLIQRVAGARPPVPDTTRDAGAAMPDPDARHALRALAEAGYLWPLADPPAAARLDGDERLHIPAARLGPEFAALTARHGAHAAEILAVRRAASVQLFGPARLSAHLAALLAASGVGRVHCALSGSTMLHHTLPGGVRPGDEGRPLERAAENAVHNAAPDTDTRAPDPAQRPDLTVLTADGPVADDRRRALHARNAPYLAVTVGVDHGVVGPLVLPGLTSCLGCADLHRQDRDPAWPALAAQLSVPRRYGPACDAATATFVAATAAMQALTFLDGGEPAVIDATLELRLPDWRLRRRSWPPHPDCDCAHSAPGGSAMS
ncbi:thiamine biosynthesis protein ThiF [uncultured Jatrophihabitans sp.]|uniref:thiamine biosynthesis protein ThiF n=1 Tax=uncultured Jatrophihabitans sp. TaxID=1610747 RepID=UPI0035CC522E